MAYLFIGLLAACLHFLPTIIAFSRRKRRRFAILGVNFFAGWTGLGWLAALIWALLGEVEQDGCGSCSRPTRPGSKFCPNCGTPLTPAGIVS